MPREEGPEVRSGSKRPESREVESVSERLILYSPDGELKEKKTSHEMSVHARTHPHTHKGRSYKVKVHHLTLIGFKQDEKGGGRGRVRAPTTTTTTTKNLTLNSNSKVQKTNF